MLYKENNIVSELLYILSFRYFLVGMNLGTTLRLLASDLQMVGLNPRNSLYSLAKVSLCSSSIPKLCWVGASCIGFSFDVSGFSHTNVF